MITSSLLLFAVIMTLMRRSEVLDIFYYHGDGYLCWRNHPSCKWLDGKKVGTTSKRDGYRRVCVSGKMWLEHKLIYLYHKGFVPNFVDHKNRIRHDNRISNLREATKSENGINKGKQSNNKSGYTGVCWDKQCGRWKVQLNKDGKRLANKTFSDIDEAIAYRKEQEDLHFKEWKPCSQSS